LEEPRDEPDRPEEEKEAPDPERRPPPYATDRETLEKESVLEFTRGSGPGGQHRNRRETAVRVRHLPSGITLIASERRSQARNRDLAFERLSEKLTLLNRVPKKRKKTRKPRSADRKRLESKKKRASVKKDRRRPGRDE
jgi:protein subunit release factor B